MKVEYAGKHKVTHPEIVANIFYKVLEIEEELDRSKEHFWVIGLKSNNVIQYIELVSLGTMNASLVHPREVFRTAIFNSVASIIIAHNHPSGELIASHEDKSITQRLLEAGKLLDMPLLDHIIIGGETSEKRYFSFKEEGYI